jgi:alpha-N-arabinofuranosidase
VNHSQVILRSRAVSGPFEPWALNPRLTQRDLDGDAPGAVTCTGHADFVIGPDGQWWAVFLGCRPLPGRPEWLTGRETFLLPVRWTDDGWPQILPPGERVPLRLAAPGDAPATASMPTGGNFHSHDRFEASTLSPDWFTLRAPQPPCWSLSAGRLKLSALEAPLTSPDDVALLARRVQHARFEVTTMLQVPRAVGITAGLALFQSAAQHDLIAVRRSGEGLEVFAERVDQAQPQCVARRALPAIDTLTLRIRADEQAVHYSYALDGGDWQTLTASLPIDTLTVQAAGGGMHFTGAVIGLHARSG